ncbi:hypothetical protein ULMS_09790 [Patiriisocius marinistellae]|uniref:TonB C-terminal domain-containing protein n=1 Tax=Patiriisocius marinistellae TaxID=2494560 RepID=A0A5J4G094_9FLAO|nr:energy transducer TonB [Patiriisocius marinistellae]GEQ85471.1 hypothetical protein ULMS_09790 [Patiriisocius marinistellae]
MKNLFLLAFVLISASTFAQDDPAWGTVQNNTLTMKEIAPVWPGCSGSEAQKDKCFNQKLTQHIVKNFKYPMDEYKKNIQGRVVVDFVINEQGKVEVKNVTGGNKGLQDAARANIEKMPTLKPGMMGGKPRAIKMSVPFNFKTNK